MVGITFYSLSMPLLQGSPLRTLKRKALKITVLFSANERRELPWWLNGKKFACHAGDTGDMGSIPKWGRFPGGGNGNLLQYSCWRIPWTEEPGELHTVHRVAKNRTRLKRLSMHACIVRRCSPALREPSCFSV